MLYDTIHSGKIKLCDVSINGKEDTFVPVLYDGTPLVFSLKNKYISVNGNDSRDEYRGILIRSKQYARVVEQIFKALYDDYAIIRNHSFYAYFGDMTKIVGATEEDLKHAKFEACISLAFKGNSSRNLQVYVKDLVWMKFENEELEIELDKLELAS